MDLFFCIQTPIPPLAEERKKINVKGKIGWLMSMTFSNSEEFSTYRNLVIEISLLFKLAFINYDDNKCFLFWMKVNVL